MPYNNFTLAQAKAAFSLEVIDTPDLFGSLQPVAPSSLLAALLADYLPLATAINTEKARSELLIMPVLAEMPRQFNQQVSLFSGTEFNVDASQGLTGFCDYLLSASPEQFFIAAPVVTIVEAKNENIIGGLGQCASEMVAAQTFNTQEDNEPRPITGAVTTGTNWRFLQLADQHLYIDRREYYIKEVDCILAILSEALGPSIPTATTQPAIS